MSQSIKDMESAAAFGYWWHTEGKNIEGKFALAVAAWESSREVTKKVVQPLVTSPAVHSEFTQGTREVVLTLEGKEYQPAPEPDVSSCIGCVFENDHKECNKVCELSRDYCLDNKTIWIKKEN